MDALDWTCTPAHTPADLNGSAGADFHIAAHATGNLDTGNIQLYSTNLPGLSIPGSVGHFLLPLHD